MNTSDSKEVRTMTNLERRNDAIKPAKGFQSLDEEAEFWDTHSAVDAIDEGTIVGFRAARKSDTMTVRFAPDDIARIREEAIQKGLGPTTLIRMWVLEHLKEARKEEHGHTR
jgi:predicted DNA binding CopG/RHH family protein